MEFFGRELTLSDGVDSGYTGWTLRLSHPSDTGTDRYQMKLYKVLQEAVIGVLSSPRRCAPVHVAQMAGIFFKAASASVFDLVISNVISDYPHLDPSALTCGSTKYYIRYTVRS